jgi:hypothetical protein
VFTSWPARAAVRDRSAGADVGAIYVNSVCTHSEVLDGVSPHAGFSCRELSDANGVGFLRIAADNQQALDAAVHDEQSIGRVLSGFQLLSEGPVVDALPNAVRTAPLWLAALFAFIAWLPRLRPRRRAPAPPERDDGPAAGPVTATRSAGRDQVASAAP